MATQEDKSDSIKNSQTVILRQNLHDEIVPLIRDMILDGKLLPGIKIPERELCLKFGVSRTPMREALKVLASEGLLRLLPNRGAIVSTTTRQEITALFPIIGALEALAGQLACENITQEGMEKIVALHETMSGHFQRGEWLQYTKLNRAIHEALFEAAGNTELTALYRTLTIRIHNARYKTGISVDRWKQSVEDHEKIVQALLKRDARKIAAILKSHLANKAEDLLDVVEE